MQVTVKDESSVKKILHIEVPESDVVREIDTAYDKLKKTAKIKGFRQGKAPRSLLEGMFKKDVHADVTSKLIQVSFLEALKETDLDIIGQPKVDPPALDEKGPYKYDALVEVKPELKNIDFHGLPLTKSLYKVSDKEIEAQLSMLQRNLARMEVIKEERSVKEGDFVVIDYEGFKDGKPYDTLEKTESYTIKIGSGIISKDFDNQIIGMNSNGDKTFEIHFPEDHYNKKLANLTITFKVKLKEIREEVIPDINDDFAKNFGPFQTLNDLKNKITENLTQGYEKRIEHELNEQIFTQLIEKTSFELPETLVNYELETIIMDAERYFAANNISMEQIGLTREKLTEKYKDTAEKQVRRHLILGKIIQQEKLALTDQELDDGYKEISEMSAQPIEKLKKFYAENPEKLEFFKHTLLEKKAIHLIIKNGNITEKQPELETSVENKDQESLSEKS